MFQAIDYLTDAVLNYLELAGEVGITDEDFRILGIRNHRDYIAELQNQGKDVTVTALEGGDKRYVLAA